MTRKEECLLLLALLGLMIVSFFAFMVAGDHLDKTMPESKYVILDNKSDCHVVGVLLSRYGGGRVVEKCSKLLAYPNGTIVRPLLEGESENRWHYESN